VITPLLSLLALAPKVQYDLWVADPSWVREPLIRKRVEETLQDRVSPSRPWIRGLTEDGRIFNAAPAGFWSEGRFDPLCLSEEDAAGAFYLTFLLPDGRFAAGGASRLNGIQVFAHGVLGGGIFRGSAFTAFDDKCFASAVSPSGLLAGVMDDGDRQRHEQELGEFGNPCRIVNMRAVPLRFDAMGKRFRPTPFAINDKGVVLGDWDSKYGTPSYATIVWEANGNYWLTDDRFKLRRKTIDFKCLSNDGRFAGSRHEIVGTGENTNEVEHAIVSDGKSYQLLSEAAGVKQSCVTHIVGQDYLGWTEDRVFSTTHQRGCLWHSGKMVSLQSLLAKKTDWNIGKVGAVNKRGQIAVWLWKIEDPAFPRSFKRSFGLMTPRR
jgi:hypothetical protein